MRALDIEITLEPQSKIPLNRQLTDRLRRAIIDGDLAPGKLLPSLRDLASILNVSRSTVMRCFDELAGQGYIVVTPGSGTSVCHRLPGELAAQDSAAPRPDSANFPPLSSMLSQYGNRLLYTVSGAPLETKQSLNYGGPPVDAAPIDRWRNLVATHSRGGRLKTDPTQCSSAGFLPLRKAYSAYLARTRAISCDISQVFVFTARELRLDLICRILLEQGDAVAVEDPGYPGARKRFAVHGARVLPIPVDHQGMSVDHLRSLPDNIKIVYVTPSHHEPTGVVMPMLRRKKLLEWAQEKGAFIIEDDYDSEYRYDSRPIPSLMSLDNTDSVIHLSCLWKTLSPVSKLGFLVVPRCLVEILGQTKDLIERETLQLESLALTEFIEEGHLERIISKNRRLYAGRRQALADSLKKHMGNQVTMSSESAGMDLFIRLKTGLSDDKILQLASRAGLPLVSASPYYAGNAPGGEFIIPFSLIGEDDIRAAIDCLAKLIAESAASQ